jgi:PAS domain S-box-containing protein
MPFAEATIPAEEVRRASADLAFALREAPFLGRQPPPDQGTIKAKRRGMLLLNTFQGMGRFWRDLPLVAKAFALISIPVLVWVAGFSLIEAGESEESLVREQMDQMARMRETLNAVTANLAAMESAARGFVIGHQTESLQSLHQARTQAASCADQVQRLAGDSAQREPASRLRTLVAAKIQATETLAAAGSAPAVPVKPALFRSDGAMEAVREAAASIDREEQAMQQAALLHLARVLKGTIATGRLITGLGLFGAVASILLFCRSLRRRMKLLQMKARALKMESPLLPENRGGDEIGQLQSELERASEVMASRAIELRTSEAQLRTIIDHTGAIVYIKDLESRFLMVNRGYEQTFGLSSAQAIGRGPVELFGEEFGGQLRANDLAVLQCGQPAKFEERILRDGQVFTYISVKAPLIGPEGKRYGNCGI